ncbi:MAG TPA: Mur ligase family protein, partial [Pirellulaceae bacterium]|nr:Mur ligase family protein [Pirellulaceae bacterium]
MELRKILTLRGPSIWGLSPALEAWVDDQPIAGLDVNSPAVHALWKPRLAELTAALSTCSCPSGVSPGGASEPRHATPADLVDETELPRILARVAAEAQATLVGREPQVHVARLERDHAYQAVFHYQDEHAGRRCLDFAVEFCGAVLAGTSLDLPARLLQLAQAIENGKPAAGVRAICSAAIARGVPVMKTHASDVLQLGWGSRQHRLTGLTTDRTAAISASFLTDPNVTWKMLQAAGVPMYDPDETVPPANYRVLVDTQRWIAAIKLNDATSTWHDAHEPVIADLITQLTEGARMLGLHVAEFALAVPDLTEPLDGKQRGVVSVSAKPDVEAFCAASPELARRVGQAVVDGLLPNNQSGRIPVIAVTGTNGKTTTTRLCAHIVAMAGKRVGMTCTDGIYINGRRIDTDDCSGPRSARNVLMNPTVDAAVLETARGGILREGLAFDRCDVAVVTNIGEGDHLGLNGVHTKEQIARVKRVIADAVAPHGVAVLKADDPLTA